MANPEWGTKRICQSCGTKFYDLHREPIVCPKCKTEFDPEAFLKTRRRGAAVASDKEAEPAAVGARDPDLEVDDPDALDEDAAAVSSEEEDEDMIEDASELGEDEDDMAEVIENVDEDEER